MRQPQSRSTPRRRVCWRTKPHASIFETALAALETEPAEAVMVGDSYADDIEGARALGDVLVVSVTAAHISSLRGRL